MGAPGKCEGHIVCVIWIRPKAIITLNLDSEDLDVACVIAPWTSLVNTCQVRYNNKTTRMYLVWWISSEV